MNDSDTLSGLATLASLEIDADILGGTNLRLVAGAQSNFPVGTRQAAIQIPEDKLRLMALTIADQSGMTVLRGQLAVQGERIGYLGAGDFFEPLPTYVIPALASWRTWTHFVNFEFMRPNDAAVEQLRDLCLEAGFVERPERQEPTEPKQIKSFDRQAPGDRLTDRFANSLVLTSAVLVPDLRIAPGVTEYTNRDNQVVQRPAFTSFIDVQEAVAEVLVKAIATKDREAVNAAVKQLSHLTGINPESDYPHRPTLGYVTPKGHDEVVIFPDREESSEAAAPAAAEGGDVEVTAVVGDVSEQPFGG